MPLTPSTNRALSRRERERRMRRQAILAAARNVFAEQGYARATIDEIAERAEFGKGTLYNYFSDGKEGILFAIFDEIYETLHGLIAEAFEPARQGTCSFREAFERFAHEGISYFLENKNLFYVLMKESHRFIFSQNPERARFFADHYVKMVDAIAPVIEVGIDAGELKPLPPRPVAHILLGNVNGMLEHLFLEQMLDDVAPLDRDNCLEEADKDPVEILTALLFDGLLRADSSTDA